jgi:hypothetical protein
MDAEKQKEFEQKFGKLLSTGLCFYFVCFDKTSLADLLPKNIDGWPATEAFLLRMVQVLLDYVKESNDRNSKLINFMHPDELSKVFDCSLSDMPEDLSKLIADSQLTLQHCVSTIAQSAYNIRL